MPPALTWSPPRPVETLPIFPSLDPAFAALIRRIPPVGATWPLAEQVRWLRAFAAVADLVYETDAGIRIAAPEPHPRTP